MHNLPVATKLRQLSHIEILLEGERPDSRLRHLLGHISIHDSVERWRTDHADGILLVAARRDAVLLQFRARKLTCQITSTSSPLKIQTLSQFQAMIRTHLDEGRRMTVYEKVISNNDCEEDVNKYSEGTLHDGSEEEMSGSGSEDDDLIMDIIKNRMVTKL